MKQRFRLVHDQARYNAKRAIDEAPDGHLVTVSEPTRTTAQNALMWVLLGDIAKAKPEGRDLRDDQWKCLFMDELGIKPVWEPGLSGGVVNVGYKSSYLTVGQMTDMIELIYSWGTERAVRFSEPPLRDAA